MQPQLKEETKIVEDQTSELRLAVDKLLNRQEAKAERDHEDH